MSTTEATGVERRTFGQQVDRSVYVPRRSVVFSPEVSHAGNLILRVGREIAEGDDRVEQTEHVVLHPDEAEAFVARCQSALRPKREIAEGDLAFDPGVLVNAVSELRRLCRALEAEAVKPHTDHLSSGDLYRPLNLGKAAALCEAAADAIFSAANVMGSHADLPDADKAIDGMLGRDGGIR